MLHMGQWSASGWNWDWKWAEPVAASEPECVAAMTDLLWGIQPQRDVEDRWVWMLDSVRGFTVKSCYSWCMNQLMTVAFRTEEPLLAACNLLWKNDLPSKVLVFCWRLLLNKLPSRENLHKRVIIPSINDCSCVFCLCEVESVDHVFSGCCFVKDVWQGVFAWMNVDERPCDGVVHMFNKVGGLIKGNNVKRVKHLLWTATMWQVWLVRNKLIFQGVQANVNSIVTSIKYVSWWWFIARRGRNSGKTFSDWFNCLVGCLSSL